MKKRLFWWFCLMFMFQGIANAHFFRPNVAVEGEIVSSTPAVQGSAAGVNDGLMSTYFYSYTNQNGRYYCEFVLDLKRSIVIDTIDLYLLQTRGFRIDISEDNAHWTQVITKEWTGSVSSPLTIPFSTLVQGRYLHYYGWASWNQYVGLQEMAVYENGSVEPASSPGKLGSDNIAATVQVVKDNYGFIPDHPLSQAFDGDVNTTWMPAGGANDADDETGKFYLYGSIVVDFGREVKVGKVIVKTDDYHANTLSFPENPEDFWGGQWLFASVPEIFDTDTAGSGELVFEINGRVSSRYMSFQTQIFQAISLKPSISEIEVYEWVPSCCPDEDGDGVCDECDRCPGTPTGVPVYSDGCPAILGDFNNNRKLDLGDCVGILRMLTGVGGQGQ